MKKFAVIGQPIKHSLSPKIHYEFAKETGIDISYEAIEIDPKDFKQKTMQLFESGYTGLNVTLPLKELAYNLADELSQKGRETRAVNTLWYDKEKILADSTDGVGLLEDLSANQIILKDKEIGILGAGGAVRSILPAIISKNPKKIIILNRTLEKASSLADEFQDKRVTVEAIAVDKIPEDRLDGIINATSVGTTGGDFIFNPSIFRGCSWTYDLSYSKETTKFNQLAENSGIKERLDGLGMLVHQAAASFQIWHRIKPQTKPVLNLIKASL
tara:strand:+ start:3581 stop:4396 length:816 start_codon:yes stop_codon:yes gene_type:complete